jgi:hypothetical protein
MLRKESKIRVLENFYAIDYVFFGKPLAKIDSCCPLVKEEYLSIKGALMSVFIEMLKMVDHRPAPLKEFVDSNSLSSLSKRTAHIAREAAGKIISTPKSRKNIKESVTEFITEHKKANVSKVIEQKITEKAFSIAIDALLIGRTLNESKKYDALNEWEGRILEDSYKILRDNLVETAYQILDGKTEVSEAKSKGGVGATLKKAGSAVKKHLKKHGDKYAVGAYVAGAAGLTGYAIHRAAKMKQKCKDDHPGDPQAQWRCYQLAMN